MVDTNYQDMVYTFSTEEVFNALARLSRLSVWFVKLGIYPELIEPGKPQQNGVHERMHRTLKQEATIHQSSSRTMPERIEPYEYPGHYLVRRVSRSGTIRVFHNQIFVSNTLHEDYVGLDDVDDGVYDLFFCFYQIGRYVLRANKIHNIVSKVPMTRMWADLPTRV